MDRLFAAVEKTDDGVEVLWAAATGSPFATVGPIKLKLLKLGEPRRFPLELANPKRPLRFSVGRPGHRSSVWRLWANQGRADVYLSTRHSAGLFKVSLHASGDWRLQWVTENRGDVIYTPLRGPDPTGRVIDRWQRPPATASGWTDALSIWVPAEDVSEIPDDAEPGHDAQWMQPAAPGGAIELRVVLVKPDLGLFELTPALEPHGNVALINGFRLVGGEAVLLLAATKRLDDKLREQLAKIRRHSRESAAPGFDLAPESGPRTAVLNVDQDGYRSIWDLSLARQG